MYSTFFSREWNTYGVFIGVNFLTGSNRKCPPNINIAMTRQARITFRISSDELKALADFADKARLIQSVAIRVLLGEGLRRQLDLLHQYRRVYRNESGDGIVVDET